MFKNHGVIMEKLWAPWRIKYIREIIPLEKPKKCIFCHAVESKDDRKNLVLYRGKYAFIMLNLFPYNSGHLMIAPFRHVASLEDLLDSEELDLWKLMKYSVKLLKISLKPDGFNIGINLGKVAGAGVEDHLHIHIVPRWCGDTNFMPVIGNTKVIPEGIYDTYDYLSKFISTVFREYEEESSSYG